MTQAVQKLDRNNNPRPVKRLKSRVKDFKDIQWRRDTGNIIIDTAIISNGFDVSILFKEKEYEVKSPPRKIIKELKKHMIQEETRELSVYEKIRMDDAQEILVQKMIVGLNLDEDDEMTDLEYDSLAAFCWEYYEYSKKKSMVLPRDSS